MTTRRFAAVLIATAAACAAAHAQDRSAPVSSGPNPELEAYIATVRARGMTDEAYQALLTVAAVRSGATVLDFNKDPQRGIYRRTYMSSYCARPNADPKEIEKLKQEQISARKPSWPA